MVHYTNAIDLFKKFLDKPTTAIWVQKWFKKNGC